MILLQRSYSYSVESGLFHPSSPFKFNFLIDSELDWKNNDRRFINLGKIDV